MGQSVKQRIRFKVSYLELGAAQMALIATDCPATLWRKSEEGECVAGGRLIGEDGQLNNLRVAAPALRVATAPPRCEPIPGSQFRGSPLLDLKLPLASKCTALWSCRSEASGFSRVHSVYADSHDAES